MPNQAEWTPLPTPEERAAQLRVEERATTRDIRRGYVQAILGCVAWLVAGLGLVGWALHTTDPAWGEIAFLSGLIVGYAGITFTLARFYLRGEEAGWW